MESRGTTDAARDLAAASARETSWEQKLPQKRCSSETRSVMRVRATYRVYGRSTLQQRRGRGSRAPAHEAHPDSLLWNSRLTACITARRVRRRSRIACPLTATDRRQTQACMGLSPGCTFRHSMLQTSLLASDLREVDTREQQSFTPANASLAAGTRHPQ